MGSFAFRRRTELHVPGVAAVSGAAFRCLLGPDNFLTRWRGGWPVSCPSCPRRSSLRTGWSRTPIEDVCRNVNGSSVRAKVRSCGCSRFASSVHAGLAGGAEARQSFGSSYLSSLRLIIAVCALIFFVFVEIQCLPVLPLSARSLHNADHESCRLGPLQA